jgi:tetratricopeptide (TPR) repeat protein
VSTGLELNRISLLTFGLLAYGSATYFARTAEAQQLAPKRVLAATAPQGCAALLSPAPVSSGPSSEDVETRRLISAGQDASLQGEHAAARDAFAAAAKRSPQNAVLAYYLGLEYEALGAHNDAVKEYCRYLQLSPKARDADEVQGRIVRLSPRSQLALVDEARANFRSALALLERRQYIAADSMFGSIATRLPNSPEVYFNRALSRAARGERTLAMQDFQKYIDLSGNPTDRGAINAAVARLQDRVFGSGQALSSGVILPGMGQMSTGRPFLGVAVLGAVAGALVWGLAEEQGFEVATFQDPFGNPYIDSLPRTTRPNFPVAAAVAAVLWGGAAYEAMVYARRTQARAESIIQITRPITQDGDLFLAVERRRVGAGMRLRLP